jgi:hypothetical protein
MADVKYYVLNSAQTAWSLKKTEGSYPGYTIKTVNAVTNTTIAPTSYDNTDKLTIEFNSNGGITSSGKTVTSRLCIRTERYWCTDKTGVGGTKYYGGEAHGLTAGALTLYEIRKTRTGRESVTSPKIILTPSSTTQTLTHSFDTEWQGGNPVSDLEVTLKTIYEAVGWNKTATATSS